MPTPESGGGWSERDPLEDLGETDTAPGNHPFTAEESSRYVRHDVLGVGGMGEVCSAWDRRLGREVAVKRLTCAEDDATAVRLAREAWITARLEHPGIVPVYDAGRAPDGRLFYAMRLVRGRSFSEVLAVASRLEDRLALLRQYLAACHAVAYAHEQGVVQRDIKPANLMLGEFGETVVVDWGLAVRIDESEDLPPPSAEGAPRLGASVHRVGTPAYMAPEQARGEPATPGTDVWALGAILFELLTSRPLVTARSVAESAEQTRSPDLGALQAIGLSAELVAIAHKALAPEPRGRYRNARQLAADVAAFLDGRRVTAHAYSPLELLRRLAWAWRWPLGAAAIGLVAALSAFALTWLRVVNERERAVVAESRTRAVLDTQRKTAARALVSRSVLAHEVGAEAVAEVLAATALLSDESLDARGVLAGAHAAARPSQAQRRTLAPCARWYDSSASGLLCALHSGGGAYFAADTTAPAWVNREPWADAALVAGEAVAVLRAPRGLLLLDRGDGHVLVESDVAVAAKGLQLSPSGTLVGAATAAGDVVVIDAATHTMRRHPRPCASGVLSAFALAADCVVAACPDGSIEWRRFSDGVLIQTRQLPVGAPHKGVMSLAVHPDGRRLAVGGVDGTLWTLRLGVEGHREAALGFEPLVRLKWQGTHVVAALDRGGAVVWEPELARELLHLPVGVVARGGDGGQLVGLGRAQWTWQLPDALRPARFVAGAGLSQVTVSPDGVLLAGAAGDGSVTIWARASGTVRARIVVPGGVAKWSAFSADGARLAVASAGPAGTVTVWDTARWTELNWERGRSSRRVAFFADGRLVGLPYGDGLDLWGTDGRRSEVRAPRSIDGVIPSPGDQLWLLTEDERVVTFDGSAVVPRLSTPGALTLAVGARGDIAAVGRSDSVEVHRLAARLPPLVLRTRSGNLVDVAITRDGRYVVGGTRSGTSDVWSLEDGRQVAALRGHSLRNAAAAVAPEGQLITASWDGTARGWDLDVLRMSPERLKAMADQSWALSLEEALGETPATAP